MIQGIVSTTNLLAAISSAFAAFNWYSAAQVKAPPKALPGAFGYGGVGGVDATPLVEYAQESGRRNKVAAWSAIAALFAFVGWALGTWVSWTSVAH